MSSPFPIPSLTPSSFPFLAPPQNAQSTQAQIQTQNQNQNQISQSIFQAPNQTSPQPLGGGASAGAGVSFAPSPLSQLLSSAIPGLNMSGSGHGGGSGSGNNFSTGLTPGPFNAPFQPSSTHNHISSGISPSFLGVTPNTSALLASVGVGLGPSSGATPTGTGITAALSQTQLPTLAQLQLQLASGPGLGGKETSLGLEGMVAALNQVEAYILRGEAIQAEIAEVESRVFGDSRNGDGERLLALHTEYNQLLQTIYMISQTHLIGSLPSLTCNFESDLQESKDLSSKTDPAKPDHASAPLTEPASNTAMDVDQTADGVASTSTSAPTTTYTISDLANWAEQRAALEFSRREALKAGGKAVLDILRLGAGGASSARVAI